METLSIILNFILGSGLIGTLLFFKPKRRKENASAKQTELENTEKVVAIQTKQIGRLDSRVQNLEEKVDKLEVIIEKKDGEIDRGRFIIRQAYKCRTPPEECPVLQKQRELVARRKEYRKPHKSPETPQPEEGQTARQDAEAETEEEQ